MHRVLCAGELRMYTHTAASFCISGITAQQPACSELLVLDTLPKYALCRIFCEPACSVFVCVCVHAYKFVCVFFG